MTRLRPELRCVRIRVLCITNSSARERDPLARPARDPRATVRRRGRPRRLSRAQIVEAALEILAGHPADQLTMARVAKAVGAVPMALYRHVANRDDLMDAVLDAVMGGLALELPAGASWEDRVARWMHGVRAHLLRYPGAVKAIGRAGRTSPAWLEALALLARVLEGAGLRGDALASAMIAVSRTTMGWIVQEIAWPISGEADAIATGLGGVSREARDRLAPVIPSLSRVSDDAAFRLAVAQVLSPLRDAVGSAPERA
jgi:AcrR family transcriptional regulator